MKTYEFQTFVSDISGRKMTRIVVYEGYPFACVAAAEAETRKPLERWLKAHHADAVPTFTVEQFAQLKSLGCELVSLQGDIFRVRVTYTEDSYAFLAMTRNDILALLDERS